MHNPSMESPKRLYRVWRGRNKFFLGGRFIFGPDVRSVALTLFLIIAPVIIFCARVVYHPSGELSSILLVAIGLTVFDLVLLFLTSGRDPGIVPRNTHPPEPEDYNGTPPAESYSEQTPRFQIPRNKDVIINGVAVKVKFCYTCMVYRSPRCSHCSICNNCVERFDHHCPWVGQCIGQRNYRFFFMFVLSSTLLCTYVFAFCLDDIIKYNAKHNIKNILSPHRGRIASVVLVLYTFVGFWFVGGLAAFHVYLICTNQTTYENFRSRYESKVNPYNRGVLSNITEVFFTKIPPSRNNFREKVQPDSPRQGFSDSNVYSNIISPNTGKGDIDLERGGMNILSAVGTEASEDLQGHDSNADGLGLGSNDVYGETLAQALGNKFLSDFRQIILAKVPSSENDFHEKVQWDSTSYGVPDSSGCGNIMSQNRSEGGINLEIALVSTLPAICTEASEDSREDNNSDNGDTHSVYNLAERSRADSNSSTSENQ